MKKPIPRKPAAAKKTCAISLRITERLKKHIDRQAASEGITASDWITELILQNARQAARINGMPLNDYLAGLS
jgi:uncharacterized protein (DUF1778 family)